MKPPTTTRTRAPAPGPGRQQCRRRYRSTAPALAAIVLVAAALALALAPTPAVAGLFSSSSRGSGSSYRPSSSSSYKPVSSGYGYKPTYKPSGGGGTPSFSAPKPGASAPFSSASFAPPSNFGSSFLGGRPGAASYGGSSSAYRPSGSSSGGYKPAGYPAAGGAAGLAAAGGRPTSSSSLYKPSRPSKMTSLAVPFALGAGAGALTSSAFRSGSRSCGDGRMECFEKGCDQARRQCPNASQYRLRRVRCPESAYAECWAAGGDSMFADGRLDQTEAPAFLCMGKARPRSSGDVVAQCFNYNKKGASSQVQDDDHVTAEQLLAGDPAYPSTKAFAAPAGAVYYSGSAGRARGGGGAVLAAAVLVAAVVATA